MTALQKGANASLPDGAIRAVLAFATQPSSFAVDISAYLLRADGRVRGDDDMIFYNQASSPNGAVKLDASTSTFLINPVLVPADVDRIAICVVTDGASASALGAITIATDDGTTFRHETSGQPEAAVIVAEIYRRGESWKLRAIGQGFAGGLAPLAKSFGMDVEDDAPAAAAPAPIPAGVDLRKQKVEQRLINLAKTEPKLVSLAKKAGVSLAKQQAGSIIAKFWLVLDVSGSMRGHFRSGAVQELGERALAYGLNLDDDGSISVLLFDDRAQIFHDIDATNYHNFAIDVQRAPSIWGTTDYGNAMAMLRDKASREPDFGTVPVFVMFVTDGGTSNRQIAERQIRDASSEAIFWKFMAIGEMPPAGRRQSRALPAGFDFLAYLDDMPGRVVDNADFFAVAHPTEPTDEEFFDLMSNEFSSWIEEARKAGVLRG